MKILIVDDQSKKLSEVYKSIKELEGIESDNIEHVLDLNDARKKLHFNLYDFLILDLNMPDNIGENPECMAGKEFIEEIIGVDSYIKPVEIIILTEYEELKQNFLKTNNYCFEVLKYDSTVIEWANILRGKIKYLLAREKNKIQQHKADVALITAVKVETEAVKKLSDSWVPVKVDQDPTIYYKAYFGENLTVIHAQQSEMGMSAAATLTTKIINIFSPKYIIMPGIAAGIGKNKNFGDILIPTEIWNYSSGKYIKKNESLYGFEPNPGTVLLDPAINELLSQDFDDKLNKIRKNFSSSIDKTLNIIRGPLACGSAVVANDEIVNNLIKQHQRKTIGLDMESYGMFYAALHTTKNCFPICMKSICDFADEGKCDDYQEYAAYTSANFAKYSIENILEFE